MSSNYLSPCNVNVIILTIFPMLYITYPWLTVIFITGGLYLLFPFTFFTHPPTFLPSGDYQLVFCIYESVSFLNIPHINKIIQYFLSVSDLVHLAWYSLGSSILSQMTRFYSFYGWEIFHYICTICSLSIHLWMDI